MQHDGEPQNSLFLIREETFRRRDASAQLFRGEREVSECSAEERAGR
jgi:hypothetical protein